MSEHIRITILSPRPETPLGQLDIPLRACRKTNTAWVLPAEVNVLITYPGLFFGVLFELPDGQKQTCTPEDIGMTQQVVMPHQMVTLHQIRVAIYQ